MLRLREAREAEIDAIYGESHALWGGGLDLEDYRGLWDDLARTAWVRRHARFLVLADASDAVLSSTKVYRPKLRLFGRTGRATVVGALFTPRARRGGGHGRALLERVVAEARREGSRAVLLFSDIGDRFYAPLGFRALPAREQWVPLRDVPETTNEAWTLRPMRAADRADIRRAQAAAASRRPIAIERDAAHWEFLRVRSRRFFERLGDPSVRMVCQTAYDGARFAGYLIAVHGRGEWSVREVGARDGDAARMAAILRLGAEQARCAGLHHFYGWLAADVGVELVDWGVRVRRRRRAVPMLLPLHPDDDVDRLAASDAAFLPFQDQF